MSTKAERIEAMKVDVDVRLTELWAALWRDGAEPNETVAACMRTAYAIGYRDALTEDGEGRRGELHKRHGYAHP